MSSRGSLTRRLYTDSHVRVVPIHFTASPGKGAAKGNKIYEYHLSTFAAAYMEELDPGFLESRSGVKIPNLAELQKVTKGKKEDSLVLRHLCGNLWCVNPFHVELGTKTENDLEDHCHYFLRQVGTMDKMIDFQESWCKLFHIKAGPPCWSNVYQQHQLKESRLSLSQVPEEEEVEDMPLFCTQVL